MRGIPSLQVLCLRSVGSHACSTEETFSCKKSEPKNNATEELSTASKLLRSFHQRPSILDSIPENENDENKNKMVANSEEALKHIPMDRTACIDFGSGRRANQNEVDLNHPWIGCKISEDDERLVMQKGSPVLDLLQSYINSLVELGRMDDTRLGVQFFKEWKDNVLLAAGIDPDFADTVMKPPSKRRRRSSPVPKASKISVQNEKLLLSATGSLSLHNCTFSTDTVEAMVKSGMGPHLAVLDLTGVHALSDDLAGQILPLCPQLERLSLKNCRRITVKTLELLCISHRSMLVALDLGGSYNISTSDVLDILPSLPALTELHASGLGWTDDALDALMDLERPWKALSLGFSLNLTQKAIRASLARAAGTLQSLAVPFCETVMDNAGLGIMGRNLPNVRYLDVRGNSGLTTLTGWYDGRASANLPEQALFVLGRYSGLNEGSVEETKRIHLTEAKELTAILGSSGTGIGITSLIKS